MSTTITKVTPVTEEHLKKQKAFIDNPKTLKDLRIVTSGTPRYSVERFKEDLKQLAITHIKDMRREGRPLYNANIDEKSAIPKLMEIFNLNDEDVK